MKIQVLGTRGEIEVSAPYHAKKSGVLLDNLILFDCGDERFLSYHPRYILITHLHPDHAYFVRHHEPFTQKDITLYAPEAYEGAEIHVTHMPFVLDSYTITPIPTIHSIKVKSQAYLVEHAGQKILYTGDMIWIEKQYHHLLANIDLVITEASFLRAGGMVRHLDNQIFGHTGVPDLIALFKHCTTRILFVHFGSWFYQDSAQSKREFHQLAEKNNLDIIVGYDGLELML